MSSITMNSQYIAVVDYGMGNLHSAKKALELVSGRDVIISRQADEILQAQHVVVPGVGAIRDCMAAITQHGLDNVIHQVADQGTPLLGICIGMQLFLSHSEENGGVDCLGLFPERVENFAKADAVIQSALKVPHMGWNRVKQMTHPLWHGITNDDYFYFVHSFFAQVSEQYTQGVCHYGVDFSAAMAKQNVFAVQFHPEKSGDNGLQLLKNFVNWNGCQQ